MTRMHVDLLSAALASVLFVLLSEKTSVWLSFLISVFAGFAFWILLALIITGGRDD